MTGEIGVPEASCILVLMCTTKDDYSRESRAAHTYRLSDCRALWYGRHVHFETPSHGIVNGSNKGETLIKTSLIATTITATATLNPLCTTVTH